MTQLLRKLWNDEEGFIVSAELVLISTITVLSMVVGLAEVSNSINNELFDVANAFDAVNQRDDDHGHRNRRNRGNNDQWDVVAN